jgi:ribose 5-phosphate isomerase B
MRIAIGSDHAGVQLKDILEAKFTAPAMEFTDFGTNSPESIDYPDIASVVAEAVASGEFERGILVCGTGIGMSICANKVPGIRAALCHNIFTARCASLHNDANVIAIGARVTDAALACDIVATWLETPFEGGRHNQRLAKIKALEDKYNRSAED